MLVFVEPDSSEWNVMWSAFINKDETDPASGESWQYMGTTNRGGTWRHEFRHRRHPVRRERVYVYVPVSYEFEVKVTYAKGGSR
jgi:hypothetical protein